MFRTTNRIPGFILWLSFLCYALTLKLGKLLFWLSVLTLEIQYYPIEQLKSLTLATYMEAFSVLMGTCQYLCRYVLFCLFFSSRLPSFYLVGIFLSAYISYQSPRFCLCYCFSSLSAFWGQGTGCVTLFYSMASTILSRKAYMINYCFN